MNQLDSAFLNNAADAKDVIQLDSDLYTALSGWLVDGARSHSLAEKNTRSGFAIWKRLVVRYEPLRTMKVKELMTEIVHFAFDDKDFVTSFDLWETKIGEHEGLTGLPFDLEVKSTHLLDLHQNVVNSYALLVVQITTFYTAQENEKARLAKQKQADFTQTPAAQVNAVWWKGGKGKGKGKGKKGKGKNNFNFNNNWNQGHNWGATGTWGKSSKGTGKGKTGTFGKGGN